MNIPENFKYTETHEWISTDTDIFTIGITDHAQDQLGEIVYVELPEIGKVIELGETVAVIESVKAASDVYAPVIGEIIEVNADLEDSPEKINHSAYEDGWLFKIRSTDTTAVESLLDAATYKDMNEI